MSRNTRRPGQLPTGNTSRLWAFWLPGSVLGSSGAWPWTSALGLLIRRYSAGRSKVSPLSNATVRALRSLRSRSSVGQGEFSSLTAIAADLSLCRPMGYISVTGGTEATKRRQGIGALQEYGMDFEGAASVHPTPMVDPFGRAISYLRVSVTDRCDFRCVY